MQACVSARGFMALFYQKGPPAHKRGAAILTETCL
jgi:hypothetical protein